MVSQTEADFFQHKLVAVRSVNDKDASQVWVNTGRVEHVGETSLIIRNKSGGIVLIQLDRILKISEIVGDSYD
jgi:desulfoferrodoxin (superoxide reductase-like protein)